MIDRNYYPLNDETSVMQQMFRIISTVFVFYFAGGNIFAFAGGSSVKAEVDKAFVTIGDRIQFRVTVTHEPQARVTNFNAESSLSDFEIKEVTPFSNEESDQVSEGTNFVITAYELGDYVIRSFKITVQHKDGSLEEIETNPLYLTVQSVGAHKDQGDDIRGAKGVHALHSSLRWWLASGGLLGLGIAIWFFWRALQKRAALKMARALSPLSPHEEAYRSLYQLKHSDLLRKGEYKTYFFRMSEILKHYFERRYGIHAMESTTYELLKTLREHAGQNERQQIQSVLEFCDAVKFAKHLPEVQEVLKLNKSAVEVVDVTKKETLSEPAGNVSAPA